MKRIIFNTAVEQEWFEKMYSLENYGAWLKKEGLTSTFNNLKAYKNYCFNWVLENVWDI